MVKSMIKNFRKHLTDSSKSFKKYGYEVQSKNEQIKSAPFAVGADIIQKYYKVVDADDRTTHHESISDDHITKLITEFLIVNPQVIMCL
jgi:hypothetical protein